MTTVTAVTAFLRAGAVSKTSSRSSRLSRGAGSNVKGAYLWVEIAARQYNPNPLIFGPRRTLAGWWKGCAFPPAQRRVEKFRRGAGRPFQRAALLGEATAVAGGKAPAPPRRAHGTFAPTGRKCHSGLLHFPQEVPSIRISINQTSEMGGFLPMARGDGIDPHQRKKYEADRC